MRRRCKIAMGDTLTSMAGRAFTLSKCSKKPMLVLLVMVCCCAFFSDAASCRNFKFSDTLGDNMVLQREPASAAVYGSFRTPSSESAGEQNSVMVSISDDSDLFVSFTVKATISFDHTSLDETKLFRFKALLHPMPAGRSYTVEARCGTSSGENDNNVTLHNVTFGDVWYCGGQSNMALPLEYTMMRNASKAAVERGKYGNISTLR